MLGDQCMCVSVGVVRVGFDSHVLNYCGIFNLLYRSR